MRADGADALRLLLIGVIFFGLGDDYAGIQDRQGDPQSLFMAILNQMLGGLMNVVMLFPLERRIFEREHAAGFYKVWLLCRLHLRTSTTLSSSTYLPLYKVWPYFLSRVLFETPLNCFFPLLYSAIIYFLAGLQVWTSVTTTTTTTTTTPTTTTTSTTSITTTASPPPVPHLQPTAERFFIFYGLITLITHRSPPASAS